MMWWVVVVLGLVLCGRAWPMFPTRGGRVMAWVVLVCAIGWIDWHLQGADPILRMVALCCALLGGLKSIVYLEWSSKGGRSLGWGRYLGFSIGWFGMDPQAFARKRGRLEWKSHFWIGIGCVVVGTVLSLVVRSTGQTHLLLVFVPMSLGFHYGALRVLTAGWRAVGVPVRVLFRNPLLTTGLADFWAKRWNLGYSQMMARVVVRPLESFLPRPLAEGGAFLVSGLLHEVAITIPVGAGMGGPTLYFLMHGVAVKLERKAWLLWVRRLWVVLWVIIPIGLLFPEGFHREVILSCLEILPEI